jgi:uncharacterized protein YdeI (YjbR/CyaY-like superfamily)
VRKQEDKPRTFSSRARLRAWLERNHARAPELNLRLFKVHARERGVTYRDALDEALCFGWIDGVRRAYDADSFTQRFSPRRQYLLRLTANSKAHSYYQQQAPWYRRVTTHWVMSAKQEETRQRRLEQLIVCCEQERAISPVLQRKTSRKQVT